MTNILTIWRSMPRSERIGCFGFAFGFPLFILALALVLPN